MPLALHYACVVRDWNFSRSEAENVTFSCEPLSFLIPNQWFATYRPISSPWHENVHGQFGLGLAPWLFGGSRSVIPPSAPATVFGRAAPAACAASPGRLLWPPSSCSGPYLIICKQRTDIPLPYLLLYHLAPGAKGLRVPTRFVLPLLFCLSVMAGFTVAHFERFARTPIRYPAPGILAAAHRLHCSGLSRNPCQRRAPITTKPVPPVYDFSCCQWHRCHP
ncbi:MAG: hypothetical protein KatS3mg105_1399 [Gemmatales bacterium]|nr:MAG: hypothetical protein KatS3mg105_1399 [Gemmatales bacterium]